MRSVKHTDYDELPLLLLGVRVKHSVITKKKKLLKKYFLARQLGVDRVAFF